MPPFARVNCTHCGQPNRFDVAELREQKGTVYKGVVPEETQQDEEFEVHCKVCGRSFKLTVKGGQNGGEQ